MRFPERVPIRPEGSSSQYTWDTTEALAIMLRRLAYPARIFDLELLFGIGGSTICEVYNVIIDMIYHRFKEGIRLNKKHLNYFNLKMFSDAIASKGAPYQTVVAFIDGTHNPICRPTEYQECVYNGHYKEHCLKYQASVTPDGMTVSLDGPFWGTSHDQRILDESGLVSELEEILNCEHLDEPYYAIYADPAFRASDILIRPFPNNHSITREKKSINKKMSKVRECVEWEFGHVSTLFGFLKFTRGQKIELSRVGKFYIAAIYIHEKCPSMFKTQESNKHIFQLSSTNSRRIYGRTLRLINKSNF